VAFAGQAACSREHHQVERPPTVPYPGHRASLTNLMAEFGFIMGAVLGATAGTTDLTEGVFRNLVITGRSRLALYLARIPAGLAILLPLIAAAFAVLCLVTSYEGIPQPNSVSVNGVSIPAHFDQAELQNWLQQHPQQAAAAFRPGPAASAAQIRPATGRDIATFYGDYTADEISGSNPAVNEMAKIGLWTELEAGIGFMVGLGLGSLTGQRTVTTIVLIGLEIIVTRSWPPPRSPTSWTVSDSSSASQWTSSAQPPWRRPPPAMAPEECCSAGGEPSAYPPMPTWAMITVIAGWIIGWSVIEVISARAVRRRHFAICGPLVLMGRSGQQTGERLLVMSGMLWV
jgi:hypothetical protein